MPDGRKSGKRIQAGDQTTNYDNRYIKTPQNTINVKIHKKIKYKTHKKLLTMHNTHTHIFTLLSTHNTGKMKKSKRMKKLTMKNIWH